MKMENDLGRDDIRLLVMRIALPSMLAQFVSVLYSVVDRIYRKYSGDRGDGPGGSRRLRAYCHSDYSLWFPGGNRRSAAYEHPPGRKG